MSDCCIKVVFTTREVRCKFPQEKIILNVGGYIPGPPGWSPELAVVADGERRVLQVLDWFGGYGTKPDVGQYLGAAGFVSDIADATNVRGAAGAGGSLGDLPEYQNDEDAIADGLIPNVDFYLIADGSDVGLSGTPKMVRPL